MPNVKWVAKAKEIIKATRYCSIKALAETMIADALQEAYEDGRETGWWEGVNQCSENHE